MRYQSKRELCLAPQHLTDYSSIDEIRIKGVSMSVKLATARQSSSKKTRHRGSPLPQQLAVLAKALGHPARIQVIETLLSRHSCIGCDIADEIGLAASTTSEHLRILKEAGLIIGEIERPRVCYSIDPTVVRPLIEFLRKIEATTPPRFPEQGQ